MPSHRAESPRRFAALPGAFPCTERCAAEPTAGAVQDRFGLAIGLMIDGLPVAPRDA
ncbi:hypothetical protein [Streptomyces olivaceoviridis]|uniref:hypothetical protein n=1 Tax=Streptomyces olivaceoviridis TaxID=1921 RepID=UPI00368F71F9